MDQSSSVNNESDLIDCGVPTVLKGARILADSSTTTEGSEITLICSEDLFSNYTITSACTREGKWYPDPAKFQCISDVGMHHPLSGYAIAGISISILLYIIIPGVFIAIVWRCQHLLIIYPKVSENRHDAPQVIQREKSKPVYENCSLSTSREAIYSNAAYMYEHCQINNMYI